MIGAPSVTGVAACARRGHCVGRATNASNAAHVLAGPRPRRGFGRELRRGERGNRLAVAATWTELNLGRSAAAGRVGL